MKISSKNPEDKKHDGMVFFVLVVMYTIGILIYLTVK